MDNAIIVNEFTKQQIEAAVYLALDMPIQRISSAVGVSEKEIKSWLGREDFISLVARQKTDSTLHFGVREQLIALANQKLLDILSADYTKASQAERREIARTAKFVIENSSRQSGQTTIVAAGAVIGDSSASAIARHLAMLSAGQDSQEIDADYRISSVSDSYVCHPETAYGMINFDAETEMSQCHICGKWVKSLSVHVPVHGISFDQYKKTFRIISEDG